MVTITLNANGGAVMGELPTPTRANHRFVDWYTAATGGIRVTELMIAPANNVTYFARWVPELVSTTSTYTYRADGLRHSKTVNGVTTYHIWDRGNIVLELNASGAVINRFDRGARGQLIRSHHHGWYVHDARGSVVQRVNAQGTVLRNYRYTAFGNEVNPLNPTNAEADIDFTEVLRSASYENGVYTLFGNAFSGISTSTDSFEIGKTRCHGDAYADTFAGIHFDHHPSRINGEYWDAHRGEYYLRARSYNPRTGRFSQPDPFFHVLNGNINDSPLNILQAGNLFVFAVNNPVMWIDPSGFVIELAGTSTIQQTILSYLQKLTDHQLGINSYGHVYISVHAARDMSNLFTYGNALIERLIASEHVVRVHLMSSGGNYIRVDCVMNASIVGVGSGSRVGFNRLADPYITTLDSAGLAVLTRRPAHIGLAHELIHAERNMRGERIAWDQVGTITLETARAGFSPARMFGSSTRTITHTFQLEEMATIGINYFTANCITENMIRREHGLPIRASQVSSLRNFP